MEKKLINIAKALYTLAKSKDLTVLYKFFMGSKPLSPYKNILTPTDIVKVVFFASEIGNNRNPEELLTKLNNLYLFSIISFGDDENWIECEHCAGSANVNCGDCYGRGYVDCDECNGGNVSCDTCDGYGELEDNETCPDCNGRGHNKCKYCNGEGEIECEYCYGSGQLDCPDCDGEGEIESDEYVPYEIYLYVSYDTNLRTSLERSMVRNEEILNELTSNKTFNLNWFIEPAGGPDTDMIDHKYINTQFVNGVNEIDDLRILKENLTDSGLLEINPKFFN